MHNIRLGSNPKQTTTETLRKFLFRHIGKADTQMCNSVYALIGKEPSELLEFHLFLSSLDIRGIRCKKPDRIPTFELTDLWPTDLRIEVMCDFFSFILCKRFVPT